MKTKIILVLLAIIVAINGQIQGLNHKITP